MTNSVIVWISWTHLLVKRVHFVVAASLTTSVLYALSGALVVLCVLLSRAWGITLAVVCYALLFPLVDVVLWLLSSITSYWLAGCVKHAHTATQAHFCFEINFDIFTEKECQYTKYAKGLHNCFPLRASSRINTFWKVYIWHLKVSHDIWTIWLTLCICRTVFHPAMSVQHTECRSVVAILAAGGLRIGLTDTCSLSSLSKISYCSFRLSSDI